MGGILAVVLIVFLALTLFVLPPKESQGARPAPAPTSAQAVTQAESFASNYLEAGEWEVVAIQGISLNSSAYFAGFTACSQVWIPGDGGTAGAGTAPFWLIELGSVGGASSGNVAEVEVENGTAFRAVTTDTLCAEGDNPLQNVTANSTAAYQGALSDGGSSYLSKYPRSNVYYQIDDGQTGGILGPGPVKDVWQVTYNLCPWNVNAIVYSPQLTVDVNASTGAAMNATTASHQAC